MEYTLTGVCVRVCAHACVSACVHVCACERVCMCACVCVLKHTYLYVIYEGNRPGEMDGKWDRGREGRREEGS